MLARQRLQLGGLTRQSPSRSLRRPEAESFAEGLEQRLQQVPGLEAKVVYSGGKDLDILPCRAGKGRALQWLLCRMGEGGWPPLLGTLACGDSGNDIELFRASGVLPHPCTNPWASSVAMGAPAACVCTRASPSCGSTQSQCTHRYPTSGSAEAEDTASRARSGTSITHRHVHTVQVPGVMCCAVANAQQELADALDAMAAHACAPTGLPVDGKSAEDPRIFRATEKCAAGIVEARNPTERGAQAPSSSKENRIQNRRQSSTLVSWR